MADTARVTQSVIIAGTLQVGAALVTQSVIIAAAGLGISCNNPPNGLLGVAYSHFFLSGSGEPPVTFAIILGSLPPGLSLNPVTGEVTGVPTTPGIFHFTVQATDSFTATASVDCQITVPGGIMIQLIGWKMYPNQPCADLNEIPVPPKVDRAV